MHGFVAYGKSTFAKKLAHQLKIPRISMDDIYIELHGGKPSIGIDRTAQNELAEML
jgi:adenylate kinase family enzyme